MSARSRWLSALEFTLGAGVVIAHNVYRLLPNEVPILFFAGWISIRLRNGGWRALGLTRPASWTRTLAAALGVALLRIAIAGYVIEPLAAHYWPAAVAPAGSDEIRGHVMTALLWLGLVWTFAAFGEELSYRGYLLTRGAEAGGSSRAAYWLSMFLVSILFGYGHYYKGPAGILDSGMAGLLLGSAYLLSRRNLWVPIFAHGLIDTIGVVAALFGWD